LFRTTIVSLSVIGLALATPVTARAADVPFAGPAGWSHVAIPAGSDASRKVEQWHIAGDVATVTVIKDGATPYADSLGTVEKNFSDNKIKPAMDKDTPCQGKTAHVIEFATGPDNKKIVLKRVIVPDGKGVVTITYARSDGSAFDPDVEKSLTAFCAAGPT